MKLFSHSLRDGEAIPVKNALGRPDGSGHATFADNLSPHIAWSELPAGTQSLVLLYVDADAPTRPDDVNQDGRVVPYELPRADFVHWVLVDLEPGASPLEEGEFARGMTPKGKPGPESARGTRSGINDYTSWFKGNADLEGTYFGYDGPFPPWNDARVHHYRLTLCALDVARCSVEGVFTAADVRRAITGHVLAEASIAGTYRIYAQAVE